MDRLCRVLIVVEARLAPILMADADVYIHSSYTVLVLVSLHTKMCNEVTQLARRLAYRHIHFGQHRCVDR